MEAKQIEKICIILLKSCLIKFIRVQKELYHLIYNFMLKQSDFKQN